MLQSIRDKSQGWVVWLIVVVICITFALWGTNSFLYSNRNQDVVAKVNGVKILRQQSDQTYNQLKRQQQLKLGGNYFPDQKTEQSLKDAALQSMINNIVIFQGVQDEGFRLAPDLLQVTLAKMPVFQVNGVFSQAQFSRIMDNLLYTPEQFLDQLRTDILINELKTGLVSSAFVLPSEVSRATSLINQTRSFSYGVLPLSQFTAKVNLPKGAVSGYYQKNQAQFTLPEKVKISYLELSMKQLMQKIHPTDSQVKNYYQSNISRYTQPARWKLMQIFVPLSQTAMHKEITEAQDKVDVIQKALKKGVSFETIANKQTNADTKAAWITSAEVDPAVQGALMNMKKKGSVSGPLRTSRGYEFVKLFDMTKAKVMPFASVSDKVAQAYRQEKAEAQFSALTDQLSSITYEHPHSLQEASKKLNLPIQTTGYFTKDGASSGMARNAKIVTAAFSDDVLLENNNSDSINLNDNDVVVLRVQDHQKAIVKSLSEVRSKILQTLTQEAASKAAKQWMDQLVAKIQKGASLKQADTQHFLRVKQVPYTAQHGTGVDSNVLNAAFQIQRPAPGKAGVTSLQLPSGDFSVVVLKGIKDATADSIPANKAKLFETALQNNRGLLDYQLYANGLMHDAKIVRSKEKAKDDMPQ